MTSVTARLQQRVDRLPAPVPDERAADPARRILLIGALLAVASLLVALVGLAVDPRQIGGEAAWVKPAEFGVSITLYLVALRWILASVHGHRRLLTRLSVVVVVAFGLETLWVDGQVLRGTTSHFNTATPLDAVAFQAAGGVVSLLLVATVWVMVLALRTRGLDAGVAAGIRWGLAVSALGMLEAVSMLVNGFSPTAMGGHTVGGPDGGPGMALTGWSLTDGDLRIAHFAGLHALQALPLLAWLLQRRTGLGERTRRALMRVAGTGAALLVVLLWWQAERGQALMRPDAVTLGAAAVLVAALAAGVSVVLRRGRRTPGRLGASRG